VLPFLLDADKRYEATVRFGLETDTHDCTGQVVAEHPLAGLTAAAVAAALDRFRGDIAQVPPMYSALKHDGRPLYSYARAGQVVARAPRRVSIHELSLLEFMASGQARLRIRCSKGTYVRQLAADLGHELGVGAHLIALRRTASGPFTIEDSVTPDELRARVADGRPLPMLSLLAALTHLPKVTVDDDEALALERGQPMTWQAFSRGRELDGRACAVVESAAGPTLVAVVEPKADGNVKILRGFRRAK
jgi:tRNA pseudouridine55 synthase